jgi:hypothetical protein
MLVVELREIHQVAQVTEIDESTAARVRNAVFVSATRFVLPRLRGILDSSVQERDDSGTEQTAVPYRR